MAGKVLVMVDGDAVEREKAVEFIRQLMDKEGIEAKVISSPMQDIADEPVIEALRGLYRSAFAAKVRAYEKEHGFIKKRNSKRVKKGGGRK